MKQNERLLVYAVTGFLALILVVAVVFGDTPRAVTGDRPAGGNSLGDLLGGASGNAGAPVSGVGVVAGTATDEQAGEAADDVPVSGLKGPVAAKLEQPLRVQAPSPSALVKQKIGPYRKDHTVRFVIAKPGDSMSILAKRWCGKVQGFVEEVKYLNETTEVLLEGREYGVPWVDDEVLLAILEAEEVPVVVKPTLVRDGSIADQVGARASGAPRPASAVRLGPVVARDAGLDVAGPAAAAAPAFTSYTVKDGDALWPILAKRFGKGKVPSLLKRVEQMNPGLNLDLLPVGKQIKLPKTAE